MQKWELNLPLRLAEYDFVIDNVQMIRNGYIVHFHSGTEVPEGMSFLFNISGGPQVGNHTAGHEVRLKDQVLYDEDFVYGAAPYRCPYGGAHTL